jgi:hypothetical protein
LVVEARSLAARAVWRLRVVGAFMRAMHHSSPGGGLSGRFVRRLRPLTLVLGLLPVAPALVGQSLADRALGAAAQAVDRVLVASAEAAAAELARTAVSELLDALGPCPEREAIGLVLADLRAHQAGRFVLGDATKQKLLDEVRHLRTRGRPERMLVPLLALHASFPDDPRVLYCLGEAFGMATPLFDAARAENCFTRLLDVMTSESIEGTNAAGRGTVLGEYLPELRRAGTLLEEPTIDTTARFRQQILGFREKLREGTPIGLWSLADPQLTRLYECLSTARRQHDQVRSREVLEAMLALQPINPVLEYALAEVRASLGPEWDRQKSIVHLDTFLALTDPALLGGPDDRAARHLTASEVARDLVRFRWARPRTELEAARIGARELRDTLAAGGPGLPLLLAPHRQDVEKRIRKLESERSTKQRYLGISEGNVVKFERHFRTLPSGPRYARARQEYADKIEGHKKDAARYRAEVDELTAEISRHERAIE